MWIVMTKKDGQNYYNKHITTFNRPYPAIDRILKEEYNMSDDDVIQIRHTRRCDRPGYNGWRTKFKHLFKGTVAEFSVWLREYYEKNVWKNADKHKTEKN